MPLLKRPIFGKPIGIWLGILILIFFAALPFLFSKTFFPHWFDFVKRGMWKQALSFPGLGTFVVGLFFTLQALVGIYCRRMWGMISSSCAFAVMLAWVVMLMFTYSLNFGWFAWLIVLGDVGISVNRRWFDEIIRSK